MRTSGRRRSELLATALGGLMLLAACQTNGAAPVSTPTTSAVTPGAAASSEATSSALTSAATSTSIPSPSPLGPVGLSGVNDPLCTSELRPVVLLHGTFSTVASNFAAMAPALQATGRCVFGIDYGSGGVRPVRESAETVATFIEDVLEVTGAEQVDVVAYSQGGLVLRTALRQDGLSGKVAVAVLIAPSFHGSTSTLLNTLPAAACPACADQIAGSALLTELDAGGDLDGDVRYAVVSSLNDTVVTPVASQVPDGPADRVWSIVVQNQCPGEVVDHINLPADPGVTAWTVNALDSSGAPDPAALTCR